MARSLPNKTLLIFDHCRSERGRGERRYVVLACKSELGERDQSQVYPTVIAQASYTYNNNNNYKNNYISNQSSSFVPQGI